MTGGHLRILVIEDDLETAGQLMNGSRPADTKWIWLPATTKL
jgi:hypothetical protein